MAQRGGQIVHGALTEDVMDAKVTVLIVFLVMTLLVIRVIAYARALFPRKPGKCKDE